MTTETQEINDLLKKGMMRFRNGPPKVPFLVDMRDRVERIIAAESREERDGAVSALILSIRMPSDPVFGQSQPLARLGEELIEAASKFLASPEDKTMVFSFRGAFNTIQAVYCAEMSEHLEASATSSAPDEDLEP